MSTAVTSGSSIRNKVSTSPHWPQSALLGAWFLLPPLFIVPPSLQKRPNLDNNKIAIILSDFFVSFCSSLFSKLSTRNFSNKEGKTIHVANHQLRYFLPQRGFPAPQHESLKPGSYPAWYPQTCSLPDTWQVGIQYGLSNGQLNSSTPSCLGNGGPTSNDGKLKHF